MDSRIQKIFYGYGIKKNKNIYSCLVSSIVLSGPKTTLWSARENRIYYSSRQDRKIIDCVTLSVIGQMINTMQHIPWPGKVQLPDMATILQVVERPLERERDVEPCPLNSCSHLPDTCSYRTLCTNRQYGIMSGEPGGHTIRLKSPKRFSIFADLAFMTGHIIMPE